MNPKDWRRALGFSNQMLAKRYFQAKDLPLPVNYQHLETLNDRIAELIVRINAVVHPSIRHTNISQLITDCVYQVYEELKRNDLISGMRNNGRDPHNVYFSWLRGRAITEFLLPAVSQVLGISRSQIEHSGSDVFLDQRSFERTAVADLKLTLRDSSVWMVEVQAGFTKQHDIKRQKVREAVRTYETHQISSALLHFDVFDGRVALVALNTIDESKAAWVSRDEYEGQQVIELPDHSFIWQIADEPPDLASVTDWAVI